MKWCLNVLKGQIDQNTKSHPELQRKHYIREMSPGWEVTVEIMLFSFTATAKCTGLVQQPEENMFLLTVQSKLFNSTKTAFDSN